MSTFSPDPSLLALSNATSSSLTPRGQAPSSLPQPSSSTMLCSHSSMPNGSLGYAQINNTNQNNNNNANNGISMTIDSSLHTPPLAFQTVREAASNSSSEADRVYPIGMMFSADGNTSFVGDKSGGGRSSVSAVDAISTGLFINHSALMHTSRTATVETLETMETMVTSASAASAMLNQRPSDYSQLDEQSFKQQHINQMSSSGSHHHDHQPPPPPQQAANTEGNQNTGVPSAEEDDAIFSSHPYHVGVNKNNNSVVSSSNTNTTNSTSASPNDTGKGRKKRFSMVSLTPIVTTTFPQRSPLVQGAGVPAWSEREEEVQHSTTASDRNTDVASGARHSQSKAALQLPRRTTVSPLDGVERRGNRHKALRGSTLSPPKSSSNPSYPGEKKTCHGHHETVCGSSPSADDDPLPLPPSSAREGGFCGQDNDDENAPPIPHCQSNGLIPYNTVEWGNNTSISTIISSLSLSSFSTTSTTTPVSQHIGKRASLVFMTNVPHTTTNNNSSAIANSFPITISENAPESPTSPGLLSNKCMSTLLLKPCSVCKREVGGGEIMHRCALCNYMECTPCHELDMESREKLRRRRPSYRSAFYCSDDDDDDDDEEDESCTESTSTTSKDTVADHEHQLRPFQWNAATLQIPETVVMNKAVNSDGNNIINDYVVVKLIGRGSFATVQLVQHIHTGALHALKVLKKFKKRSDFFRNKNKGAANGANTLQQIRDELLREIAVMKLVDHPNIVKLHEVIDDVEEEKIYIIMEYCEGGPVHVLGEPPISVDLVRTYGAQLASALLYLHAEFLYHRDVKPANVLVADEGVAKLVDFGTCNSQIRTNMTDGTPAYSCPEQVRGEEVSGDVVDSWAFAVTLFQMAYGQLPFPSNLNAFTLRQFILKDDPLVIPPYPADPSLVDLLEQMLCKDLSRRLLLQEAVEHDFFVDVMCSGNRIPAPGALRKSAACSLTDAKSVMLLHSIENLCSGSVSLLDMAMSTVQRGHHLKDALYNVQHKLQAIHSQRLAGNRTTFMGLGAAASVGPGFNTERHLSSDAGAVVRANSMGAAIGGGGHVGAYNGYPSLTRWSCAQLSSDPSNLCSPRQGGKLARTSSSNLNHPVTQHLSLLAAGTQPPVSPSAGMGLSCHSPAISPRSSFLGIPLISSEVSLFDYMNGEENAVLRGEESVTGQGASAAAAAAAALQPLRSRQSSNNMIVEQYSSNSSTRGAVGLRGRGTGRIDEEDKMLPVFPESGMSLDAGLGPLPSQRSGGPPLDMSAEYSWGIGSSVAILLSPSAFHRKVPASVPATTVEPRMVNSPFSLSKGEQPSYRGEEMRREEVFDEGSTLDKKTKKKAEGATHDATNPESNDVVHKDDTSEGNGYDRTCTTAYEEGRRLSGTTSSVQTLVMSDERERTLTRQSLGTIEMESHGQTGKNALLPAHHPPMRRGGTPSAELFSHGTFSVPSASRTSMCGEAEDDEEDVFTSVSSPIMHCTGKKKKRKASTLSEGFDESSSIQKADATSVFSRSHRHSVNASAPTTTTTTRNNSMTSPPAPEDEVPDQDEGEKETQDKGKGDEGSPKPRSETTSSKPPRGTPDEEKLPAIPPPILLYPNQQGTVAGRDEGALMMTMMNDELGNLKRKKGKQHSVLSMHLTPIPSMDNNDPSVHTNVTDNNGSSYCIFTPLMRAETATEWMSSGTGGPHTPPHSSSHLPPPPQSAVPQATMQFCLDTPLRTQPQTDEETEAGGKSDREKSISRSTMQDEDPPHPPPHPYSCSNSTSTIALTPVPPPPPPPPTLTCGTSSLSSSSSLSRGRRFVHSASPPAQQPEQQQQQERGFSPPCHPSFAGSGIGLSGDARLLPVSAPSSAPAPPACGCSTSPPLSTREHGGRASGSPHGFSPDTMVSLPLFLSTPESLSPTGHQYVSAARGDSGVLHKEQEQSSSSGQTTLSQSHLHTSRPQPSSPRRSTPSAVLTSSFSNSPSTLPALSTSVSVAPTKLSKATLTLSSFDSKGRMSPQQPPVMHDHEVAVSSSSSATATISAQDGAASTEKHVKDAKHGTSFLRPVPEQQHQLSRVAARRCSDSVSNDDPACVPPQPPPFPPPPPSLTSYGSSTVMQSCTAPPSLANRSIASTVYHGGGNSFSPSQGVAERGSSSDEHHSPADAQKSVESLREMSIHHEKIGSPDVPSATRRIMGFPSSFNKSQETIHHEDEETDTMVTINSNNTNSTNKSPQAVLTQKTSDLEEVYSSDALSPTSVAPSILSDHAHYTQMNSTNSNNAPKTSTHSFAYCLSQLRPLLSGAKNARLSSSVTSNKGEKGSGKGQKIGVADENAALLCSFQAQCCVCQGESACSCAARTSGAGGTVLAPSMLGTGADTAAAAATAAAQEQPRHGVLSVPSPFAKQHKDKKKSVAHNLASQPVILEEDVIWTRIIQKLLQAQDEYLANGYSGGDAAPALQVISTLNQQELNGTSRLSFPAAASFGEGSCVAQQQQQQADGTSTTIMLMPGNAVLSPSSSFSRPGVGHRTSLFNPTGRSSPTTEGISEKSPQKHPCSRENPPTHQFHQYEAERKNFTNEERVPTMNPSLFTSPTAHQAPSSSMAAAPAAEGYVPVSPSLQSLSSLSPSVPHRRNSFRPQYTMSSCQGSTNLYSAIASSVLHLQQQPHPQNSPQPLPPQQQQQQQYLPQWSSQVSNGFSASTAGPRQYSIPHAHPTTSTTFSTASPFQLKVNKQHLRNLSAQLNALATSLDTLDVSFNAIQRISPAVYWKSFTSLTTILLNHNQLRQFPEAMLEVPNLITLDLSFNLIESIPEAPLVEAVQLEELLLRHNRIREVGVDPVSGDSILSCGALRLVDLSENPIEHLPPNLVRSKKLQLVLDANPVIQGEWENVVTLRAPRMSCLNADKSMNSTSQLFNITPSSTSSALTTVLLWKKLSPSCVYFNHDMVPAGAPTVPFSTVIRSGTEEEESNSEDGGGLSMEETQGLSDSTKKKSQSGNRATPRSGMNLSLPKKSCGSIWIGHRSLSLYRSAALKACRIRHVVLLQYQHPEFPAGLYTSRELGQYFREREQALGTKLMLPPVVGRLARRFIRTYFFVNTSLIANEMTGVTVGNAELKQHEESFRAFTQEALEHHAEAGICLFLKRRDAVKEEEVNAVAAHRSLQLSFSRRWTATANEIPNLKNGTNSKSPTDMLTSGGSGDEIGGGSGAGEPRRAPRVMDGAPPQRQFPSTRRNSATVITFENPLDPHHQNDIAGTSGPELTGSTSELSLFTANTAGAGGVAAIAIGNGAANRIAGTTSNGAPAATNCWDGPYPPADPHPATSTTRASLEANIGGVGGSLIGQMSDRTSVVQFVSVASPVSPDPVGCLPLPSPPALRPCADAGVLQEAISFGSTTTLLVQSQQQPRQRTRRGSFVGTNSNPSGGHFSTQTKEQSGSSFVAASLPSGTPNKIPNTTTTTTTTNNNNNAVVEDVFPFTAPSAGVMVVSSSTSSISPAAVNGEPNRNRRSMTINLPVENHCTPSDNLPSGGVATTPTTTATAMMMMSNNYVTTAGARGGRKSSIVFITPPPSPEDSQSNLPVAVQELVPMPPTMPPVAASSPASPTPCTWCCIIDSDLKQKTSTTTVSGGHDTKTVLPLGGLNKGGEASLSAEGKNSNTCTPAAATEAAERPQDTPLDSPSSQVDSTVTTESSPTAGLGAMGGHCSSFSLLSTPSTITSPNPPAGVAISESHNDAMARGSGFPPPVTAEGNQAHASNNNNNNNNSNNSNSCSSGTRSHAPGSFTSASTSGAGNFTTRCSRSCASAQSPTIASSLPGSLPSTNNGVVISPIGGDGVEVVIEDRWIQESILSVVASTLQSFVSEDQAEKTLNICRMYL